MTPRHFLVNGRSILKGNEQKMTEKDHSSRLKVNLTYCNPGKQNINLRDFFPILAFNSVGKIKLPKLTPF